MATHIAVDAEINGCENPKTLIRSVRSQKLVRKSVRLLPRMACDTCLAVADVGVGLTSIRRGREDVKGREIIFRSYQLQDFMVIAKKGFFAAKCRHLLKGSV